MMRIVQAAKQYVYLKSIESQLDIALRIAKSGPDKLNTLKSHARKKKSCLVLTLLYCHSKVTTLKEKKKVTTYKSEVGKTLLLLVSHFSRV